MGLAAGRQLAEKGANVVIVARDQGKLREGVEYISVRSHMVFLYIFHPMQRAH
jgi:short-subunit dehydrogenase